MAPGIQKFRSSILAGYALAELDPNRQTTRAEDLMDRVRQLLVEAMVSTSLADLERVEAGNLLGRIGDPRPGLSSAEESTFCYVPSGEYIHIETVVSEEVTTDDNDGDVKTVRIATPARSFNVDLTYHFWLSQYPVTNAQYLEFIEDDGYQNEKYWHEAQMAEAWRPGEVLESEFEQWRDDGSPTDEEVDDNYELQERSFWRPARISTESRIAWNLPVSQITWYEAIAYCRWLTESLHGKYIATLPSILEWDKAARGGLAILGEPVVRSKLEVLAGDIDGGVLPMAAVPNPDPRRSHPWGSSPFTADRGFASFEIKEEFSSPSAGRADGLPVGLHPAGRSPYGVSDMLGNLWEHTRSLYRASVPKNAEETDCSEAVLADRLALRATRGGGNWMDEPALVIGHELAAHANDTFVIGFRVVLLPVL
jgi:formylglycine-generating enzyme required for sulfatase activity